MYLNYKMEIEEFEDYQVNSELDEYENHKLKLAFYLEKL